MVCGAIVKLGTWAVRSSGTGDCWSGGGGIGDAGGFTWRTSAGGGRAPMRPLPRKAAVVRMRRFALYD